MLLPETLKLHNHEAFEFHYIYFLPWKNQMVDALRQQTDNVVCLAANNNFSLLSKAFALRKYVVDNNIQLIHSHLPWAGIIAKVAGRLANVPVIYTEHNKQERYHFLTRALNLATMNFAHSIIAVSEDVATSIRKHKNNLKASLRIILNGVNTDHFRKQLYARNIRVELNIPTNAPLVGTVAVFRSQKRLDQWLIIAKRILTLSKDAHFVIVGDGPLKNQIISTRAQLGLENRVHLVGIETEVRPYLDSFDIYMMSSIFEGLPLALLEAMSMECAVVSTDAGGVKEVIRDGQEGWLVPVSDLLQMAPKAISILEDKALKNRFGQRARERVVNDFSLKSMVLHLEQLYREVIKQP